ncbi:hypothetical protein ACWEP3_02225, partial [Streptomyces albidoflavus]
MTGRKTVRAAWPLLAVVAAAVLSGCGIRATEVPTDFGPAPSRAACQLAGGGPVHRGLRQHLRGRPVHRGERRLRHH